ncbi:MAG: type VI secretion system tube protein Hcp [Deltaproteobacteria bacterium]|nr:type VI secretion system tube protein Hcp [Deltaproteobacteria bacterium]
MALNAYLYMKGQRQGQIKGSVTQKGREDSIMVIASSEKILSPRDPQSGLPTGQRMHTPFTITKQVDKASPLIYNALCTNENITEAVIKYWTPQIKATTGVGAEVQHYTIKLVNANIASINFVMPNIKHPELVKLVEYEEIAFTYQRIEWTWNEGGILAMDDWEARNE